MDCSNWTATMSTECSDSRSLYCLGFYISTRRVLYAEAISSLVDAMLAGHELKLGRQMVEDFSLALLDRGSWVELFLERTKLGRILSGGPIFVHLLMELNDPHPIPIAIRAEGTKKEGK